MADLTGKWIGNIFGTNTGNAFLELEQINEDLKGSLRFNDPVAGLTSFSLAGKQRADGIIVMTPTSKQQGLKPGTIKFLLTGTDSLSGFWNTESGTGGVSTFSKRSNEILTKENPVGPDLPQQIYFRTLPLGALRLFRQDVSALIQVIEKTYSQGRAIVIFQQNGTEVMKFADLFLSTYTGQPLRTLKISIQETESGNVKRMVNVDLLERAGSQIRISGMDDSWVLGKAETIKAMLSSHENKLISFYRKRGLNINSLIFLCMLIVVPEIHGIYPRTTFVALIVVLLILLFECYNRFIPNTLIFIDDRKHSLWEKSWPSILGWVGALTSSLVSAFVFWIFTRK